MLLQCELPMHCTCLCPIGAANTMLMSGTRQHNTGHNAGHLRCSGYITASIWSSIGDTIAILFVLPRYK